MEEVRVALGQAGLESSEYAGHSFRTWAVITEAAQGLPEWLIKMLGRWQVSAYLTYIRTPKETLCAVAWELVHQKERVDSERLEEA